MAITSGTYASIPGSPSSGDLYLLTDSFYTALRYNGSSWDHFIHGKKVTIPPSFSWINQGSATVSTTNGGEHVYAPASATENLRIRKRQAPSTPYVITAAIIPTLVGADYAWSGILFRESSTGKIVYLGLGFSSSGLLTVAKLNSPTSWNSAYILTRSDVIVGGQGLWLRVSDNGTNRLCSYSSDGINFLQLHSVGRTDFITADEIGWFVDSLNASYDARGTLVHWVEE